MSWIKTMELQVVFCMAYHGQQKMASAHVTTGSENSASNTLEMRAAARSSKTRARAA
jgi:hypothetical protein